MRRWLIFGLGFFLLPWVTEGAITPKEPLWSIIQPYSYDVVGWGVQNTANKLLVILTKLSTPQPPRPEQIHQVKEYFALGQEIQALRNQSAADGGSSRQKDSRTQERLRTFRQQRDGLEDDVEAILGDQVGRVLAREGLTFSLPLGRELLFPPLTFEFEELPQSLIISPRNRLEVTRLETLGPDLTLWDIEAMEERVERELGVSAVVQPLGGLASFPTMVNPSSLEFALATIAHEWLHSYLFLFPLGRHYGDSQEMRTINETVANMAGKEIGQRVAELYYGVKKEDTSPKNPPPQRGDFDFNREMRNIRLTVEELLARGEIGEAEGFMRERRDFLASQGHYIRKLNQAYLAFHGSYADTPTAVSPLGQQLRTMRQQSPSLGAFIKKVANISSYQEWESLLAG